MKVCYFCRKELDISGRAARGDECPHCGADVKICLNCRFFDPNSYNECSEPQAERVKEKDRSNYCDYFIFRETGDDGSTTDILTPEDAARENLKKLFGE